MVSTGITVKNNAKCLYGAILRFSEVEEAPDWLRRSKKPLTVKKLRNSQLSLTYTISALQELVKQDCNQDFSYDQITSAIAFLSEFLAIFHRPADSQQGQTQTAITALLITVRDSRILSLPYLPFRFCPRWISKTLY
jgi:hypothetical protein